MLTNRKKSKIPKPDRASSGRFFCPRIRIDKGGDPKAQNCGWLKDKFGVSWQVFPATLLNKMLLDEDEKKSQKVMAAILKMKKIEINGLREAVDQ